MRKYLPGVFVAVTLLLSLLAYDSLPDRVPSHWNSRGEVDGYSSRLVGAYLLPLAALAIWGVMRVIPRIDPRKRNYEKFQGTFDVLIAAVVGFMCVMHLGILGSALGLPIAVDKVIFGSMGLFAHSGWQPVAASPIKLVRRDSHPLDAQQRSRVGAHPPRRRLRLRDRRCRHVIDPPPRAGVPDAHHDLDRGGPHDIRSRLLLSCVETGGREGFLVIGHSPERRIVAPSQRP
ncbi:MAG TPA: DUF1648 domain-containing protein [Gemmatimonadaceae bacterium]|nr:DUF1648 domain-containing protein [Gemmatimonadaceae bacterium]